MVIKHKKNRDETQWDEIEKSRDDQLFAAVNRASLDGTELNNASFKNCKWFDRYDAALIAFEEGRPQKLITLEKSLGLVWDGKAYDRLESIPIRVASREEVDAYVRGVCQEIDRINRARSWISRLFSFLLN